MCWFCSSFSKRKYSKIVLFVCRSLPSTRILKYIGLLFSSVSTETIPTNVALLFHIIFCYRSQGLASSEHFTNEIMFINIVLLFQLVFKESFLSHIVLPPRELILKHKPFSFAPTTQFTDVFSFTMSCPSANFSSNLLVTSCFCIILTR